MWIPSQVVTFFDRLVISVEQNAKATESTMQQLREQLVVLQTENGIIKNELQAAKVTNSWLVQKVNGLELEKAGLMEKAYNIKLPTPEIVRVSRKPEPTQSFSFEDIGDEAARLMGLPAYD